MLKKSLEMYTINMENGMKTWNPNKAKNKHQMLTGKQGIA